MAVNLEQISEKVFNLLKGFGFDVQSFDKKGKLSIDPQQSTRFVVEDPNVLVRIDRSTDTIILNTSNDLSEHKIRNMLKELANDYLLNFDYKVFDKKLKAKGEQADIVKNSEKDMADVMEGFGTMSGSTKSATSIKFSA